MLLSQPNATPLFLPLDENRAHILAQTAADKVQPLLARLSCAELASLLLVQQIGQNPQPPCALEHTLAHLMKQISEFTQTLGTETLLSQLAERFSPSAMKAGLARLPALNVELLDRITRQSATYLLADGSWDFSFCARHAQQYEPLKYVELSNRKTLLLTDPQQRLLQTLRYESDEPLNLQAFAGTGKTHLIGQLLECLGAQRTLVLAQTEAQLSALRQRFGQTIQHGMTFNQLAFHCLNRLQMAPLPYRLKRSYLISDATIAERMGFQPIAHLSNVEVATRCRLAVVRFCHSADNELNEMHLPERQMRLTSTERHLLVQLARLLWQRTINPNTELPVRSYHLIKQLSLNESITLGAEFSQILVDESHDAPIPLLQFLDRCPQATHTLGDSYQHLNGFAPKRARYVRQREWFVSMRAGREMENVLNPLLTTHPHRSPVEFVGNKAQRTRISLYERATFPEKAATLLVKDEWSLFEWTQRLIAANANFSLLSGCQNDFYLFIKDCVNLYKRKKVSGHGLLFRFPNWERLAENYANNSAFQRIQHMLERGYSHTDVEQTYARCINNHQAMLQLGRVTDARNQEFDTVMLMPDLATLLHANTPNADTLSLLYTACSRAKHHLIIPTILREHLWALGGFN